MSKTLDDYRNIVKILKFKLLTLRDENGQLERELGQNPMEQSGLHSEMRRLQKQQGLLQQNRALLLLLAQRCEHIGLAPEMVYRIMDKDGSGKVPAEEFSQTLSRIKLGLQESRISQLLALFDVRRERCVYREDYLALLSAYQLNTERYEPEEGRSYIQSALVKFAKNGYELAKAGLFADSGEKVTYENFMKFLRKKSGLGEVELTAVFVGLDNQNKYVLTRDNFDNFLERVAAIEKSSSLSKSKQITAKKPLEVEQPNIKSVSRPTAPPRKMEPQDEQPQQPTKKPKPTQPVKNKKPDSDNEFQTELDTGAQAGKVQTKKITKAPSIQLDLLKKQLLKSKINIDTLISKLLEEASKYISLFDFNRTLESMVGKLPKSDVQLMFREMDINKKGSLSISELARLWFRSQEARDLTPTFFKILQKTLEVNRVADVQQYLKSFGGKTNENITKETLTRAFQCLDLHKSEEDMFFEAVGKMTVGKLAEKINDNKAGGAQTDKFQPISRNKTDIYDPLLKKLKPALNDADFAERLVKGEPPVAWKTVFTNEWACFRFCYDTVKSLKSMWRDPEFGPSSQDKYGYTSMLSNLSNVPPGFLDEQEVEWLSHSELARRCDEGPATFCDDKPSPNDIIQGSIGDCWLISAISIVAQYNEYMTGVPLKEIVGKQRELSDLIKGVHPTMFHGFRKYGVFVMKFYKIGKPYFVIVDELVPCRQGDSKPQFGRSQRTGVQWASLMEKAYAKLHHAYSALISGDIAQGLSDLVNCLPVKQQLGTENEGLYEKLLQFQRTKQLLGCSIPGKDAKSVESPVKLDGQPCGLVYGHAYSITDVLQINNLAKNVIEADKNQLVRVRNPWGQREWELDWSEKPKDPDPDRDFLKIHLSEIKKNYAQRKKRRQEIEQYELKEDGTFLMDYKDWASVYTNLFLGINLEEKFEGLELADCWDDKFPSGVPSGKAGKPEKEEFAKKNIQYILNLQADCEVLMVLTQKDGRLYRGEKYPYKQIWNACMITVFRLGKQPILKAYDKQLLEDKNLRLEVRRQVTFWKKLTKGRYSVIPITNNFQNGDFTDKFADFTMSIYFDADPRSVTVSKLNDNKKFTRIDRSGKKEPDNAATVRQLVGKLAEAGI